MTTKEMYAKQTPLGTYKMKDNYNIILYIPYGLSKGIKYTNLMVAEEANGEITSCRLRRVHYDEFLDEYYVNVRGNRVFISRVQSPIE